MSAISTVRIMLVEDHLAFRQALASLLSHEPDLEVVAQAGSLAQAREMLDSRLDVAVVDLGLPDGDGSALIGELRRRNPGISVLVLNAAMGPWHLDDAVKARADAVLDKVSTLLRTTCRRTSENCPSTHSYENGLGGSSFSWFRGGSARAMGHFGV